MDGLYTFLEGLLNKSNKSSVVNAGEELRNMIEKKGIEKNKKGSVTWDPTKKVLELKGYYSTLLDSEVVDMLNSIPGITLHTDIFELYTDGNNFQDDLVINFNTKTPSGRLVSYCKNTSMQDCTFEITKEYEQRFDIFKGNISFTNVKFIGDSYSWDRCIHITMHEPNTVPIFKNVEFHGIPLLINCSAWKKYSDKVRRCINKGTDPGDVIKTLGLDGITKENFKDMGNRCIEIECPSKPGGKVREFMMISRNATKYKNYKYIEQNGWFIYFAREPFK